jgi:hypothetical protein
MPPYITYESAPNIMIPPIRNRLFFAMIRRLLSCSQLDQLLFGASAPAL